MKTKPGYTMIVVLSVFILQLMMLCGCAARQHQEETVKPDPVIDISEIKEPVATAVPAEPKEADEQTEKDILESETGRQDGERFEEVIMLEGMEETVGYEHVKDDSIGFEMDYDYESLTRKKEPDKESFISVYDDPEKPQHYLEVTYRPEDPDTVVASVCEELSKDLEISKEQFVLDNGESCTRIFTTGVKGDDPLQTVYVIPAGEGSIEATAHFTVESAEGFGSRFLQMLNTLSVIDR